MKIFLFVALLLFIFLIYYAFDFYIKFSIAQELISQSVPYESQSNTKSQTMLVLGDSTAVGVGADNSSDIVPALLSKKLNVLEVENLAVSGARVQDLLEQRSEAKRDRYDVILIMVGANDIIRFKSAHQSAKELETALANLPAFENLIVILSAGNVGGTKIFPWFIRPFHTNLNMKYHSEFEEVVAKMGGKYVNLYQDPADDPFMKEPQVYMAPDGLHPSSKGYYLWFETILKQTNLGLPTND